MGYGMMNGAGYMGGWGMVFGGVMMIVWIALVVAVVVLLVRWLSGSGAPRKVFGGDGNSGSALAVLRDRYARGEIDTADYEERARPLRQTDGA